MYKILFIDEQKEAQDEFLDYLDYYHDIDIEAEVMFPYQNIDEMIDEIIKMAPDATITDFRLNEYKTEISYNVPYNGVELVDKILSIRKDFPCFIMTTFDNEAVPASEDVNIVYVKNIIYNPDKENAKVTFLGRIKEQIRHYKAKIDNAETELKQLIELRKSGNATLEDEARLIELDSFLEQSFDKKVTIPSQYKELSNTEHLLNMLAKADELIKKLEDNK
ncbi:MAG: coiled-coil domain-containing protein 30 [Prevotellaceae bacterium]|jgi:hypothetical protein|nr:coiled-coil domain-containing protein 30 [Prevotellaceae bacterium]